MRNLDEYSNLSKCAETEEKNDLKLYTDKSNIVRNTSQFVEKGLSNSRKLSNLVMIN